jgi:hypothetical protein
MTQFRLTQKFAKDLSINKLNEPKEALSIFDDWFIDTIQINRKKVALITHSITFLSFLAPYRHFGGAKNIPSCIKDFLIDFLEKNKLNQYISNIEVLFHASVTFCKTKDRRVLGHMNDFKGFIDAYTYNIPFENISWDDLIIKINNILAGDSKGNYNRPIDLMLALVRKD